MTVLGHLHHVKGTRVDTVDPMYLRIMITLALFCGLIATAPIAAGAATLTLEIAVLNPESFEQGPPTGDTRWVIEGAGDFSLAEQHGAVTSMGYDLPPGRYRITVWDIATGAAAEHRTTLGEGDAQTAYLTLLTANSDLIDTTLARMNRPDPVAPPLVAAPTAPRPAVTPDAERAMSLALVARPGSGMTIALPQVADSANDFVGLSDGGDGWVATWPRGASDIARVKLPQIQGNYVIEYIEVPEMTAAAMIKVQVE